MIERLESHYRVLQHSWIVNDRTIDYGPLVVPIGNSDEPIHRWFHLKEAFSSRLLHQIIKEDGYDSRGSLRILDCFAGGGTTLVSAGLLSFEYDKKIQALGVEVNPFLHLVASTKVAAMRQAPEMVEQLRSALTRVRDTYQDYLKSAPELAIPELVTFKQEKYFPAKQMRKLLALRATILEKGYEPILTDLLKIAAASTVEPCSRLRKDGRALRHEPTREPADPLNAFTIRVHKMIADLRHSAVSQGFEGGVRHGDARNLTKQSADTYDLILFSPPYPNNIDYTEVYKMEAWYLGLYRDTAAFGDQRRTTVRSHPSIRFVDEYCYESKPYSAKVAEILEPLLSEIPTDRYTVGRQQVVKGWADDMLQVLDACRDKISDNGQLTFVVGNSSHGGPRDRQFIIAADILMSALAELVGWRIKEIRVARRLKRRLPSSFLRESVVVLRPTARR